MAPLLTDLAPYHDVPNRTYVAVEHPGFIQNIDKGLASLGGDKRLGNVSDTFKDVELDLANN